MQEYLTPEDIAKRYQVTPHAVREWCRTGKLKAIQLGKLWRIAPADLEAFIQQNKQEAQKESKKADGLAA